MATHGAYTHAQTVYGGFGFAKGCTTTQNLVGFGACLPFLARDPVAQVFVDPGNQVAVQWHAKMLLWQIRVLLRLEYATVDLENGGCGVVEQWQIGREHV